MSISLVFTFALWLSVFCSFSLFTYLVLFLFQKNFGICRSMANMRKNYKLLFISYMVYDHDQTWNHSNLFCSLHIVVFMHIVQ